MAEEEASATKSGVHSDSNTDMDKPQPSVTMYRKFSESYLQTKASQQASLCPRVNCPEKIVICLDMSQEMDAVTFRSRSGDKFAPIKLAKRAIGMFVNTKHKIDARHQFALVILRETAHWVLNFTYNPNDIIGALEDLSETYPTQSCEIGSLFQMINKHSSLPQVNNCNVTPPPYIIRTLLIYGRSHCIPVLERREALKELQSSPHFFCDIYYIHEPPAEENNCEAIFDCLCDLDENGVYYVFEVSRNPTKVYDCMSQLLAHPLQRTLQKDSQYSIEPQGAPAEQRT